MTSNSKRMENAINILNAVANRLGVKVFAPMTFIDCPDSVALAFFPNFGRPSGVVVDPVAPPTYKGDKALQKYAESKQMHYSQINIDRILTYKEDDFIELFRDWGYYGNNPPLWCSSSGKAAGGQSPLETD